jgi:hypothetical protein
VDRSESPPVGFNVWQARLRLWTSSPNVERRALLLFVATVSVYVVTLVMARRWVAPSQALVGADFIAFYMAGDMAADGRWSQLYDVAAQRAWQAEFMRHIDPRWTGVCLFLNPPHYAAILSWLAPLSYGPALAVWSLFSLACFSLAALIWRSWLPGGIWRLAVLLSVCSPPWFQAFAGGQNTFVSLLILTAFCALLLRRRDFCAGLVLALLAYKFQLLIVPTALLAFRRRWRAMAGLAVGVGVTLGLTVLLVGPPTLVTYARFAAHLGNLMQVGGFAVHKQHSWYGFFQMLGGDWLSVPVVRGLTATAVLGTLMLLALIWRDDRAADTTWLSLRLSGLIMATLLASPHLFHYDLALALLPAILWLRVADDSQCRSLRPTMKWLVIAGFIWLAIGEPLTRAIPLQITPLLAVVWLYALWRCRLGAPHSSAQREDVARGAVTVSGSAA